MRLHTVIGGQVDAFARHVVDVFLFEKVSDVAHIGRVRDDLFFRFRLVHG